MQETASRLVCSTPLWSTGVSGRLPWDCPCKRGQVSTIPKVDIPAFLPIVMNPMSLSNIYILSSGYRFSKSRKLGQGFHIWNRNTMSRCILSSLCNSSFLLALIMFDAKLMVRFFWTPKFKIEMGARKYEYTKISRTWLDTEKWKERYGSHGSW